MITCNRCKKPKPDQEYLEANGAGKGPSGRFLWCRKCRSTELSRLNELKRRRRQNQEESPLAKMFRKEMLRVEQMRRKMSELIMGFSECSQPISVSASIIVLRISGKLSSTIFHVAASSKSTFSHWLVGFHIMSLSVSCVAEKRIHIRVDVLNAVND
jgi:hypothetical protein